MARSLAVALDAPLVASTTSRLLIDLNRPAGHPQLYSAVIRSASAELRAEIASRHYQPYRAEVERLVRLSVERGERVIHVSSHSFTSELNGEERRADVGLLYHPGRRGEAELCARWKAVLKEGAPTLQVRRSYPYYGKAAGLTEQLRRRFSADTYVGVELEVNQSIVIAAGRRWRELCSVVPRTLLEACAA
jgi:predicted N-formylglutamate amidohydrolase